MRLRDRPERRLIQLLCSTADTRRAGLGEMSALLLEADIGRLLALLKRMRLLVLVGGRLLALGGRDLAELERELTSFGSHARRWGAATELASLEILDRLTTEGIRALPLKGSLLARELYGDVGARSSIDIDILVAPEDLRDAVRVLSELGWRLESDAVGWTVCRHSTRRLSIAACPPSSSTGGCTGMSGSSLRRPREPSSRRRRAATDAADRRPDCADAVLCTGWIRRPPVSDGRRDMVGSRCAESDPSPPMARLRPLPGLTAR